MPPRVAKVPENPLKATGAVDSGCPSNTLLLLGFSIPAGVAKSIRSKTKCRALGCQAADTSSMCCEENRQRGPLSGISIGWFLKVGSSVTAFGICAARTGKGVTPDKFYD